MIDLSMGSFIASFFAAVLGYGGVLGSNAGIAQFLCFVLLALSLVAMVVGLVQARKLRKSRDYYTPDWTDGPHAKA